MTAAKHFQFIPQPYNFYTKIQMRVGNFQIIGLNVPVPAVAIMGVVCGCIQEAILFGCLDDLHVQRRMPGYQFFQLCPECKVTADTEPETYVEKLLETVLSKETSRAGMAVDVLTKWLHEPRAIVPLLMLLERKNDMYSLVIGARGLGWLGNAEAVPVLKKLLLNESQPYVARVAAVEALGRIGGEESIHALNLAKASQRPSVAEAAIRALEGLHKV